MAVLHDSATRLLAALRALAGALVTVAMLGAPTVAHSAYPDRPIRLIYPWPAGSAVDLATRVFAEELSKRIGNPVIVENKAGANAIVGTQFVAGSAPDGYTLLMTTSEPLVINPHVQANLSYDVDRDLEPIAFVGRTVFVIAATTPFPANDAKTLVALAKKDPGKYSVGTFGIADMFLASFESVTGTEFLRVPFQGGGPAITGVLGGHVDMTLVPTATATQYLASGKVKLLGVGSAKRLASLPAVPTFNEQGLTGFEIGNWVSILAPRGIPAEAKAFLQKEIAEVVRSPAFIERVGAMGVEVEYMPADRFREYLASESKRWATIVREKNIPKK